MPTISGSGGGGGTQGTEIGYDQITGSVSVTGTTEAGANTIIACAPHAFDGAPVLLQFFASQIAFDTGALTDVLGISLWEGATELGILAFFRPATAPGATQEFTAATLSFRFTPTAASHTYLIKAWATSVTGTPSIGAGAGGVGVNVPAFARFTKV